MKSLTAILASIIMITSSAKCDDGDAATPESVARAALACLKSGDYPRFQKLCVSRQDLIEFIEAVIASGELTERQIESRKKLLENIDAFHKSLVGEQKEVFESSLEREDWSKIEEKGLEKKARVEDGIEMHRVEMELSNGKLLVVDDIVKLSSGFRIFEDAPVRIK